MLKGDRSQRASGPLTAPFRWPLRPNSTGGRTSHFAHLRRPARRSACALHRRPAHVGFCPLDTLRTSSTFRSRLPLSPFCIGVKINGVISHKLARDLHVTGSTALAAHLVQSGFRQAEARCRFAHAQQSVWRPSDQRRWFRRSRRLGLVRRGWQLCARVRPNRYGVPRRGAQCGEKVRLGARLIAPILGVRLALHGRNRRKTISRVTSTRTGAPALTLSVGRTLSSRSTMRAPDWAAC